MGQTEMLEDLVGMVRRLDGDDDLELGSDYPYQNSENFRRTQKPTNNIPYVPGGVPSTNTTSYEFKNKMGDLEDIEMNKINKVDEALSHNPVQQPLIGKTKNAEIDITTDHIISILEQSLFEPYSIDPSKFSVKKLIKQDRKVDPILIQELEKKI
jgi:hypothetical protein